MSASYRSIWNMAAGLGIARPTTAEFAVLLLLGGSLLVLLAFRESYLKLWIVGWTAFVVSRLAEHSLATRFPAPFGAVAVQATFVLAVGLLSGSILLYVRSRNLIVPLAVITPILVGLAGARLLLAPDSLPLRVAVEVSYRILLLTASIALMRARPWTVGTGGVVGCLVSALPASGLVSVHRPSNLRLPSLPPKLRLASLCCW